MSCMSYGRTASVTNFRRRLVKSAAEVQSNPAGDVHKFSTLPWLSNGRYLALSSEYELALKACGCGVILERTTGLGYLILGCQVAHSASHITKHGPSHR